MVQNVFEFGTVGDDIAGGWLPVVLRGLVAFILTAPAVGKFIEHSSRAANFAEYGIPAPEITVLLVGALQIFAIVTLVTGAAGRLGALTMVPVMLTAMVVDAVNVFNVIVLVGSLGIILLGTGNYSLWDPFQSGG
jgi:uncharacterized membrane protein YphA (DoxX/SURF4 family)